jgi:predicted glycosyltransferase
MNVSYYCQHVLGIGHFHRSMAICRAIARRHPTTLILGGPPVEVAEPDIAVLRLPGLQMDSEFNNMVPCQPGVSLAEVKTARQEQLFDHFHVNRPDVFITELYPFGRKAFRFELEPLLVAVHDGSLAPCSCYCSVRDILVEKKTGREKFEQRAVQTLNAYFDGVLVHADPEIITLATTFSHLNDIHVPLHYTGFVTAEKSAARQDGAGIRAKLGLAPADQLIVGSIGGGNVGSELLDATIRAFAVLPDSLSVHLQLFCGPYCDEATYTTLLSTLQNSIGDNITIDRFTDRFPAWLEAADLSISMAGYNTCMNLLQAGVPALVYPFKQNSEQRLRAARLSRRAPIAIIDETDLAPQLFAEKIAQQLEQPRMTTDIKLNGATETVAQLERWHAGQLHHD